MIVTVAAALLVAVAVVTVGYGPAWVEARALAAASSALGRHVSIDDWHVESLWYPILRIDGLHIANAPWAETGSMADIDGIVAGIDPWALVRGRIVVTTLQVEHPRIRLERSSSGEANWQFHPEGDASPNDASDQGGGPPPIIRDLVLTNGDLRYVDHRGDEDRSVAMRLDRLSGALLANESRLAADGRLDDEALALDLRAGSLEALIDGDTAPVVASLDVGSVALRVDGRTGLRTGGTNLHVSLDGDSIPAAVGVFAGRELPPVPAYHVATRLRQQGARRWRAEALEVAVGDSRLEGAAGVDLGGARPAIDADLTLPTVNVPELRRLADAFGSETAPETEPADRLALLHALDAKVAVRVEKIVGAGAPVGGAELNTALKNGRLTVDPLSVGLFDSRIAAKGTLDASASPVTGELHLDLGEVDLERTLALVGVQPRPPGILSGEINVTLAGGAGDDAHALTAPGFGRLDVAPSTLRYRAPGIETDVTIALRTVMSEGVQRLRVDGDGRYRGETFRLDYDGDSPVALLDPDHDYALDLELKAAESALAIDGTLGGVTGSHPKVDMNLSLSGPNPARLTELTGFPLPDLPPYSISGRLRGDTQRIRVTGLDGRVGDSDIRGSADVALDGDVPVINADLESRRIDLDDLSGLIGGSPEAGPGETASAGQKDDNRQEEDSRYVLPHRPLRLDRATQAVRGTIRFQGDRVEAPALAIDHLLFDVHLAKNRLDLKPLSFGIGGGELKLNVGIDTGERPFKGVVDGEVRRVNLQRVLAPFELANDSLGIIGGRLKTWVEGDSIADFLGSADGGMLMVMTSGRLDLLLIELTGLDAQQALGHLFGSADSVPIDCAYLDISVDSGLARLETAVVDTSDTVFLAGGTVNFGSEALDLILEPHPKDFSLFTLRSAVHIGGTFKDPGVAPGDALYARAAAVAALAAAAPVAAVLPLIEPGTGEDSVYCGGLTEVINRAQQKQD